MRPLTAADRVPQVGDVLLCRYTRDEWATYHITQVQEYYDGTWHAKADKIEQCGEFSPSRSFVEWDSARLEYRTRADGGPITTEAGGK